MSKTFCHLHVHNEFSYLDGFGSAKGYVKKAKELGFTHLALTNHANIDGSIRFQETCLKEGITPIHGCELYIVPDEYRKNKKETRGHITVLVKNEIGWKNLCQMLTIANLEGFYYKPRVGYKTFIDHCEGLVVLTGCSSSFLVTDQTEQSVDFFSDLWNLIEDDLYCEVMPHQLESQIYQNKLALYYNQSGIKMVATNDCHYINSNDANTHEVLLAIQTKKKWKDKDRYRFTAKGFYLRSEDEMRRAFARQNVLSESKVDEALSTTMEIAQKCTFQIQKQDICLPALPGHENTDAGKFIWDLAEKKLLEIGKDWETERLNLYFERLREEWKVINDKNFSPYFMIVWDLVNWCKDNNIMVGPARGSAGGCLLAYLLGITTAMDPIEYNLLFSRFIAEDRLDYPDIDMDFQDNERHRVREHLEAVFGKDRVSSLTTFSSMKGRGCIRDVCRVFDIPLNEVDEVAKTVVEDKDSEISAAEKAFKNDIGKKFREKYPDVCEHILKLEGQCRGCGQHASAVIVSGENLKDGNRCNLVIRSEEQVVNWDMKDSEMVGLMKLDVLGLNTLSVLAETKRLIKINQDKNRLFLHHPESDCYYVGPESDLSDGHIVPAEFDFIKIPLNDETVYKNLHEGKTNGVFQLSAWATTALAKKLKANNISELSDIIALVRPGPADSGMTEDYIKRKNNGASWPRKHPIYEEITKNTFGLIVYQEQVMEVIHKVAGLPYTTADKIRKVIGKKRDPKEFKPYEIAFVEGCEKMKTLSRKEALEFWAALQKHANYSFNRSHSMAYAILGYWTAWCKAYYPIEFACAALTYGSDGKKEDILQEVFDAGTKIITPKVGFSEAFRWTAKGDALYIPFSEIKGCTEILARKYGDKQEKPKAVNKGFFWPKAKEGVGSNRPNNVKMDETLAKIEEAVEKNPEQLSDFFNFRIPHIKPATYNELKKIIPAFNGEAKYLSLDADIQGIPRMVYPAKYVPKRTLSRCSDCALRKECKKPISPIPGNYNIAIIGEAPNKREDQQEEGFIGNAYKLLWDELCKYDILKTDVHSTHAVKCCPVNSKTASFEQTINCSRKWLFGELKEIKCRLVLAFGNTSMMVFDNQKTGIMHKNGKATWCDEAGVWVCYCVSPAFVLRNNSTENIQLFKEGIANFSQKIDILCP